MVSGCEEVGRMANVDGSPHLRLQGKCYSEDPRSTMGSDGCVS